MMLHSGSPPWRPSRAASRALQELEKLPLGDARLNGDVGQCLIEVQNAVQTAEIEEHTSCTGTREP